MDKKPNQEIKSDKPPVNKEALAASMDAKKQAVSNNSIINKDGKANHTGRP